MAVGLQLAADLGHRTLVKSVPLGAGCRTRSDPQVHVGLECTLSPRPGVVVALA